MQSENPRVHHIPITPILESHYNTESPPMNLDDKICYCYHVPLRKLLSYARREKLQRPSQMSECLGAGTGCGWCIPILKRIYEQTRLERDAVQSEETIELSMTPEEYAAARASYLGSSKKNSF